MVISVEDIRGLVLTNGELITHLASPPDDRHTLESQEPMWPVQTLTLLLCLTDEEQLFAQCVPAEPEPVRIEVKAPPEVELDEEVVEYPAA